MLDLTEYIAEIRSMMGKPWQRMSVMLKKIEDSVNQLGNGTGVDPTGHTDSPPPPQAINVAASASQVHVTLTDNSQRSRPLNYFIEWSVNDASFGAPNVEDLGVSRGRMLPLPAKDNSGNMINYYFRGYSSYPGSVTPSEHIVYGGKYTPSAVQLTSGTSQLTPLPSTGAGTANTNGSQGGQGFGVAQVTTPVPAKEALFV